MSLDFTEPEACPTPRRVGHDPDELGCVLINARVMSAFGGRSRHHKIEPPCLLLTHLRHETRRDDECPTHLTCPLSRMLVWPLGNPSGLGEPDETARIHHPS